MNEDFDLDELTDELTARMEEAVACAVHEALPEMLGEGLGDFEFVLPGGTVVRPRQRMKLLSPDKSKLLLCYGGLRVDGSTLMVQTRVSCWEAIAAYPSREETIAALLRVKDAMAAHEELLEL